MLFDLTGPAVITKFTWICGADVLAVFHIQYGDGSLIEFNLPPVTEETGPGLGLRDVAYKPAGFKHWVSKQELPVDYGFDHARWLVWIAALVKRYVAAQGRRAFN